MTRLTKSKLLNWFQIQLLLVPGLVFAQPTVSVNVDDSLMAEADLGTGRFTITRTGDGDTENAKNVFLASSGSASWSADFTFDGMTHWGSNIFYLTIPAGELTASATFTPKKDNVIEGEDDLIYTLQDGATFNSGYTIVSQTEVEMTLADDVAEASLTLDDGTMDEASLGTGMLTVTRSNNGKIDETLLIYLASSGSASWSADFTFDGMTHWGGNIFYLTIPAGELSASAIFTPKRELIIEGDETLTYTLQEGSDFNSGYTAGSQNTAELVILDLVDSIFEDGFEEK